MLRLEQDRTRMSRRSTKNNLLDQYRDILLWHFYW
jgi:hypothetical protein